MLSTAVKFVSRSSGKPFLVNRCNSSENRVQIFASFRRWRTIRSSASDDLDEAPSPDSYDIDGEAIPQDGRKSRRKNEPDQRSVAMPKRNFTYYNSFVLAQKLCNKREAGRLFPVLNGTNTRLTMKDGRLLCNVPLGCHSFGPGGQFPDDNSLLNWISVIEACIKSGLVTSVGVAHALHGLSKVNVDGNGKIIDEHYLNWPQIIKWFEYALQEKTGSRSFLISAKVCFPAVNRLVTYSRTSLTERQCAYLSGLLNFNLRKFCERKMKLVEWVEENGTATNHERNDDLRYDIIADMLQSIVQCQLTFDMDVIKFDPQLRDGLAERIRALFFEHLLPHFYSDSATDKKVVLFKIIRSAACLNNWDVDDKLFWIEWLKFTAKNLNHVEKILDVHFASSCMKLLVCRAFFAELTEQTNADPLSADYESLLVNEIKPFVVERFCNFVSRWKSSEIKYLLDILEDYPSEGGLFNESEIIKFKCSLKSVE